MLLSLGPLWNTCARAQSSGKLAGATLEERLQDAASKNIIQQDDVARLLEYDARRFDCLLTDAFDSI